MLSPLQHAVLTAVARLLKPILRLLVAHGLKLQQLEGVIKRAYVEAAQEQGAGRNASQISMATGLHRKDVARFLADRPLESEQKQSVANQVFARWLIDKAFWNAEQQPMVLAMRSTQAGRPDFEQLARSVTVDVHPRAILDELVRLGMVMEEGEQLRLCQDAFVPKPDIERMLRVLQANGQAFLMASTSNVLGVDPPWLEQSVYADALSEQSAQALHQLARAQWQATMKALIAQATELEAQDLAAGLERTWQFRVGTYAYAQAGAVAASKVDQTTG